MNDKELETGLVAECLAAEITMNEALRQFNANGKADKLQGYANAVVNYNILAKQIDAKNLHEAYWQARVNWINAFTSLQDRQ